MRARVAVYSNIGTTRIGILPVIGLVFSEEVGGSGSCTFEALKADLDAQSAWDAVIRIELETAPGVWTMGPSYVTRREYTHRVGSLRYSMSCKGLLEAWASETVVMPEYVVGTMEKKAGVDRGIGWMSTAYVPTVPPDDEPWDRCYQTGRTAKPTEPKPWPSGTGAEWISATGATTELEAKYFRTTLTITGTAGRKVKFYVSSDEQATLWVAGERILETTSEVETGYKQYTTAEMILFPGTYAVAVYTATHFTKGGDGIDPILVAACIVNAAGDPSSWILRSNDTTWVACRRDNVPPNNIPPGPTPGQVLIYMVNEAKERNATGWDSVTYGFTHTFDSNGARWPDIIEQLFRYGHHTYWSMFEAFGESDQFDVWMGGDLVLHAGLRQGQARAITMTTTHLHTFSVNSIEGHGTWVMAQALDGWVWHAGTGPRREYALELGEAITGPIADKISIASLKDVSRYDASGTLNPPQAGWMPYVDFKLGDWMTVNYVDVNRQFSVTSLSAKAGEGGLLWDIEFTQYPPVGTAPALFGAMKDVQAHPPPSTVGIFDGLEGGEPT